MTVEANARKILDSLVFTAFENCYPITKTFADLPNRPCIYAVRHRTVGLLYIGKSRSTLERFKSGHKAFLWAWIERYVPEDVGIATYTIPLHEWVALSSELETLILQATRPPYNAQIPLGD